MHVQRELNLVCAVCCVWLCLLDLKWPRAQPLALSYPAAEGFKMKPNQLYDATAGLNVIKCQHRSRLNERVNEDNE